MYNNIPTKVLTGEVRLSYVNLVAPRVNDNDPTAKPKYSVTLLIPKMDAAVKQNIDMSIEAAATDAQSKLWGGVRPPVLNQPAGPPPLVLAPRKTARKPETILLPFQ